MNAVNLLELRASLSKLAQLRLDKLDAFREIDSTNSYLMKQAAPAPGDIHVAIADHQTAGRGRHARTWLSKPGGSLCLSLAYTFKHKPSSLPALTLALGVGSARALRSLGVDGMRLKWPNDVLVAHSKLAGILAESTLCGANSVSVVAGIGVNIHLPTLNDFASASAWANGAVDLHSIMEELPDRERLSVSLIDSLLRTFQAYDSHGFEHFAADYEDLDYLSGKEILIETPDGRLAGIATGVDGEGALLVNTESGQQRVISGSILRVDNCETVASPLA